MSRKPEEEAVVIRLARSPQDVLKVMVVRGIVFIEEQGVDWEGEIDGFEESAIHVLGEVDGQPVASGRLRLLDGGWAKLERIAVRPRWRGRGIARRMVAFLLEEGARRGADRYKLHAQVHLEAFYRDLGFTREGEVFDECGIDHVLMLRGPS
ncbi:GNAT family N-acetyltransferase [bacterium]|nr:GNAT family N-acetyltransferase [bacterium]